MKVIKVDARRNPSITLNEIMAKPLNHPAWVDTTQANEEFNYIQEQIRTRTEYEPKKLVDLKVIPARLLYFGLGGEWGF